MESALALLLRPAFYIALAVVFPLVSGALTALTAALERLELRLDASRHGWVAQLLVWALARLTATWNAGPRTLSGWGLLLLSLAAVIVAAGCGHAPDPLCGRRQLDAPAQVTTLEDLEDVTRRWCARERVLLEREILDPQALRHATQQHDAYCQVLLSMMPGQWPPPDSADSTGDEP